MQLAGVVAKHGGHAMVVLAQVHELIAGAEAHAVESPGLPAQGVLEVGLIEGHELGVAVDAATGVHLPELAHVGAMHLHFRNADAREGVLAQADHLQDAQGFVVEGDGPRHQHHVLHLVHHQRRHAVAAQQGRQGRAHRAVADHQHIRRRRQGSRILFVHGGLVRERGKAGISRGVVRLASGRCHLLYRILTLVQY